MNYKFKRIQKIPEIKDLINIILSKTQRKTPTVVHNKYKISRIRGFYIRKVKFTQQSIFEKLGGILEQFPKLEDIHPFFADLINVLYDKDHFKLALGHVKATRNICDNLAKDYVRLIKYADSLYRCKQLKRAALGRMVTGLKKLGSSLSYLEEVRKHMSRLPTIDPITRTLLIAGAPNVGKSSFTNNITNANLEVQAYPFTTQSLYVGHTDYKKIKWQVIDSPGLLDRPLEQRNTIEMQSITALAHLKACIIYFVDISGENDQSIEQQIALFNGVKELFRGKPIIIVLTKTDIRKFEDLDQDEKEILDALKMENAATILTLSNKTGNGVYEVKKQACEILQKYRQSLSKEVTTGGLLTLKQEEAFLNGLYIQYPTRKDNKERPDQTPQAIKDGKPLKLQRPTMKELEEKYGGAGVFNFPHNEHFLLQNPKWKYDAIPQIMDGKNVMDFYDPKIFEKLAELEKEEAILEAKFNTQVDIEYLDEDFMKAYTEVMKITKQKKMEGKLQKNRRLARRKMDMKKFTKAMKRRGIDSTKVVERANLKRKHKALGKIYDIMDNKLDIESSDSEIQIEGHKTRKMIKRTKSQLRSMSRARSVGAHPKSREQNQKLDKMRNKIRKVWQSKGKVNESDRRVPNMMPKHLFSGKMKHKRDRR